MAPRSPSGGGRGVGPGDTVGGTVVHRGATPVSDHGLTRAEDLRG
ncbi:hypothetical protein [Catenulispora yoronensis]